MLTAVSSRIGVRGHPGNPRRASTTSDSRAPAAGSRTNSSGTRKLALSTSSRLSGRCRDVAIATALATVEIARRPERVRTLWALSAMSGGSPLLVHASSSALSIAPQGARVHCVVNGNPGAVTAAAATVVPTMSTASRKNVDPRASIHRRREPCRRRTRGSVDSARWAATLRIHAMSIHGIRTYESPETFRTASRKDGRAPSSAAPAVSERVWSNAEATTITAYTGRYHVRTTAAALTEASPLPRASGGAASPARRVFRSTRAAALPQSRSVTGSP